MNNLNFSISVSDDNISTITLFVDDYIFIGSISYNFKENLIYISDFLIKDEFRNKGYGTILAKHLLNYIDEFEILNSLEKVVHCNDQSINIFKKLGFNEKEKYTILTK